MKREIYGILLFFLVLFTAVSLATYSPADPSVNHVGVSWPVHNFFGIIGANTAGLLIGVFGIGAFWLPVLFLIAALRFYGTKAPGSLKPLVAGSLLLIVATGGLLALFRSVYSVFGREFSGGGMVGGSFATILSRYLNRPGAFVMLAVFFLIGIILTTRISILAVLRNLLVLFRTFVKGAKSGLKSVWRFIIAGMARIRKVAAGEHRGIQLKKKAAVTVNKPKKRQASEIKIKSKGFERENTPKPVIAELEKQVVSPSADRQMVFESMRMNENGFLLPSLDLLSDPVRIDGSVDHEFLRKQSVLLEEKLHDFGVSGKISAILPGPVITRFEFEPAPGIKINKVVNLSDDLALALRALSVRIIAPIPGKAAIGIELPNKKRELVAFKDIVSSSAFKTSSAALTMVLGKDIVGNPVVADLEAMPHLLIAGATGTGKSVALNTMISSILYKSTPDSVKFIMVDPKRIELSVYDGIPHLITPVVTDMKKATNALFWAVREMERRYKLLSAKRVRNIRQYNKRIEKEKPAAGEEPSERLPYIVVVIDELADLMMVSSKDVEVGLTRLAQMARAAGIHLIIATQRPSVDVLTGVIKANFPTRLSFQVSSKTDSRTIIDCNGAEALLGKGDMLFLPPGTAKLERIHGAYISEEDVSNIIEFLKSQKTPEYDDNVIAPQEKDDADSSDEETEYDERYDEAVALVTKTGQASISMVQRHLRIGYNRAARIIEIMEKEGVVGPSDGVKAREVLVRKNYDEFGQ
ncbi:MAG: DNA translocase FtsK [Deltaproteobacteria bacterium]|nr:DNA translocase FtsK [Deltaproteobacteria bacterium]